MQAIGIEDVMVHNNNNNNNNKSRISYNDTNSSTYIPKRPAINLNVKEWPDNTCLIVGSSIISNLNEKRLSKSNKLVRVRSFPGSTVEDMYLYISPLLNKKPSHIILHVGGNNAPYCSADELSEKILDLKEYILKRLPNCNVIISLLTTRCDNMKAKLTIRDVNARLLSLGIKVVDNSNIDIEQLSHKGLHLNNWGTCRLSAKLFIYYA